MLCQTCHLWSFVGEERTHKDAMKTVIALNCEPNVVSRLEIAKGFNSRYS